MLTTAQVATLRTALLANTDPTFVSYRNAGATGAMADWYNLASTSDAWRTEAPVSAVYDALDWAKFTPSDSPDSTVAQTNRLLFIQTKQMNLQSMLQGRTTVDASKANIRSGLRDAVTQIPAGAGGASVNVGGTNGSIVLNALTRKATNGEAVFFSGSATTGPVTANLLGFEGLITNEDVVRAFYNNA